MRKQFEKRSGQAQTAAVKGKDRSSGKKSWLGITRHRSVQVSNAESNQSLQAEARSGRGKPLPADLQQQWGKRLDRDIADFRVHTDSRSAAAVRDSGANAISYGRHLFFAPGRYEPGTPKGQDVLGHELVHGLQSQSVSPGPNAPVDRDSTLEAEADRAGHDLAHSDGRVPLSHDGVARPALRGDKQITFSGNNITVSDTYVIHGPAANAAYVTRFQNALDQYYNNPAFVYRGYNVSFNLRVRMIQRVTRTVGLFDWESTDWSTDSDTSMFYVASGAGTAGGIGEITLYEESTVGTIAHEVGHYLSDRVGYFSEGYSEGPVSRVRALLDLGGRETGVKPGAAGDIMTSSAAGTVGEFSLGGILDAAINAHENPVEFEHVGGDFCWVAREVIPDRWRQVRIYMLMEAPGWLRRAYGRYGPGFAAYIRNKPAIKRLLRPGFRMLAGRGQALLQRLKANQQ